LQTLLEKRALRRDPLPDKLIIEYFLQICEGLAAIHETGTAHRDIKPANVLLAPNDRIVIMDLGPFFSKINPIHLFKNLYKLQVQLHLPV